MTLHYIQSDSEINDFINVYSSIKSPCLAFDTETTSLDVHTARLLLLQLKVGKHIFVFNATKLTRLGDVLDLIIFSDKLCIAHNAKYDAKILRMATGRELKNLYDTMYIEVLLNSGVGQKFYSLKYLVKKYFDKDISKEVRENFLAMVDGEIDFTQEEIDYSIGDVLHLERIRAEQLALAKDAGLDEIVSLESRLLAAVADMEYSGITLDIHMWRKMLEENKAEAGKLRFGLRELLLSFVTFDKFKNAMDAFDFFRIRVTTKKKTAELSNVIISDMIRNAVISEFNVNSNAQIKSLLSNILGKELDSVDKKTLKRLESSVKNKEVKSLVSLIIEYRKAEKKVSTYGEKFLKNIHKVTGRIHTDLHNIGTVTGRFSSSSPNLQNIPKKSLFRNAFVARDGYKMIGIDYSQQEFRLAGAISGDKQIIDAYISGKDMHQATASHQLKKEISTITPKERNYGKTLNFAILYGTSSYGLRSNLEIPLKEAEEIISSFYAGYPTLEGFRELAESAILELGYSVTVLGRRRYIPEPPLFGTPADRRMFYARQLREGFNHILQGTAADVTKLAMIGVYENNPFGDKLKMLLCVHDEIICEAHESIADDAYLFIQKEMMSAFIPFLGDIPAIAEGYIKDYWEKA